jgi:hypothetical protein
MPGQKDSSMSAPNDRFSHENQKMEAPTMVIKSLITYHQRDLSMEIYFLILSLSVNVYIIQAAAVIIV